MYVVLREVFWVVVWDTASIWRVWIYDHEINVVLDLK